MSASPDSAPVSALDDAIRTVRGEINDLAIQIAAAGNKPKEEVDSIRELFELRKADLAFLMSVPAAVSACSHKHEIFADIEDCLLCFEDILNSHSLDFDSHWFRLLPHCLGVDLRGWLNEFVLSNGSAVSWSFLKEEIITRYGVPKEQLRFARIREFLECTKLETESFDAFFERFKGLKVRSMVSDKYVIAKVFFDAVEYIHSDLHSDSSSSYRIKI